MGTHWLPLELETSDAGMGNDRVMPPRAMS